MSSFNGSVMSAITAESTICCPIGTTLFASGPSLASSERVPPSNSDAHLTYEDDDEVSEGEFRPKETQTVIQDANCISNSEEGLIVFVKGNTETKVLLEINPCVLYLCFNRLLRIVSIARQSC